MSEPPCSYPGPYPARAHIRALKCPNLGRRAHKIAEQEPLNVRIAPFVFSQSVSQFSQVSQSVRLLGATPTLSRGKEN